MSAPDRPEYKTLNNGTIQVYLEGKRVGTIVEMSRGGWCYYPQSWRAKPGPRFATIAEVKKDLEGA